MVHNPEDNHEQVKSWVVQGHNVPSVNCKDYETLPLLKLLACSDDAQAKLSECMSYLQPYSCRQRTT